MLHKDRGMQSFLMLDLARLQLAEWLAMADQPRLTLVDRARLARVWPWSDQSAGLGLSAAVALILQTVFADRWTPLR